MIHISNNHKIEPLEVAYHRNGIASNGFHVIRFKFDGDDFVAVVFDEPGNVAVLNLDLLPCIKFGSNSWRGDEFEKSLRDAIKEG